MPLYEFWFLRCPLLLQCATTTQKKNPCDSCLKANCLNSHVCGTWYLQPLVFFFIKIMKGVLSHLHEKHGRTIFGCLYKTLLIECFSTENAVLKGNIPAELLQKFGFTINVMKGVLQTMKIILHLGFIPLRCMCIWLKIRSIKLEGLLWNVCVTTIRLFGKWHELWEILLQ